MDRATSFDSSGPSASSSSSRGGGPGGASSSSGAGTRYSTAYERPSSAMAVHPQAQGGYNSHSHSYAHAHVPAHASASAQHSRNSSMSSSTNPYGQPIPSPSFYPSYSHTQAQHGHAQPSHNQGQMPWSSQLGGGNWASSAIPASAFYPAPFSAAASAGNGGGSGSVQGQGQSGSVFQAGFQQSQPDFAVAAWAGAYQQMMMAQHFQNQHNQQQQQQHSHFQLPLPPPTAANHAHSQMGGDGSEGQGAQARRRTSSGPSYVQPRVVAGSIFAAGGGAGNGNGNGHGPGTGAGAGQGAGVGQGWPSITHRQSFDDGRSRPSALVHALPSYSQRSASDTRYAPNQNLAGSYLQQQNPNQNQQQQQQQQQGGGYHPYKRNTSGGGPSRKSSKEELKGAVSGGRGSPVDVGGRSGMGVEAGAGAGAGIGLPRSKSQPSLASVAVDSPGPMAPMSAAGSGYLPSGAASSADIAAAPPATANAPAATPAAPPTQAEGVSIATAPASTGDSIVPADEVVRARTISGESKMSTGSGGTVTPGKADTTITAITATSPAPGLGATEQKPAVRSASAAPSVPAPNTASATATATATAAPKSSMAPRASTPLYAGQITNATNTPHPHPQAYSPAPTPELAEKKSIGGLKGRLAKALHKDRAAREGKMGGSTPPSVVVSSSAAPLASANTTPSRPTAAGAKHHQSPSESSTRSGTPPITPPAHVHSLSSQAHSHALAQGSKQSYGPASSIVNGNGNGIGNGSTNGSGTMHIPGSSRFHHQPSEMQPMRPPSAPFAMPMHHQAMSSDVSLAETERTQRTANTMGDAGGSGGMGGGGGKDKEKEKGKRSLFRMRNMSTDNISLSSTVSSASMMIRKMGSIGKLARRNSLMGISKIFKDKPKDEDGPLPEREGDKKESKKEKKERKKREKAGAAKGELAPAEVSRMSAEPDNDDRVISGLTPAAQLARQHTLRSRAEAEAKARAAQQTDGQGHQQGYEGEGGHSHDELGANTNMTGEPTWDGNTFNRPGFPTAGIGAASSPRSPTFGPNVVHVQPRTQAMNVQHARAVTIPAEEYDSDDSSDGETMEDTTVRLERNPLAAAHSQGQGQGGRQGGQRNSNRWSQTEESRDMEFRQTWGNASIDRFAVPKKGILKRRSEPQLNQDSPRARSNSAADAHLAQVSSGLTALSLSRDPNSLDGISPPVEHDESKEHLNFTFDSPADISSPTPALFGSSPYSNPGANTSAPVLSLALGRGNNGAGVRSMTAPAQRRGIMWAPECAVYSTYDAGTYDRRSEPATCNNLTPELAHSIKQELNAFKLEMPVHPASKVHTHYFS